MSCKLFSALVCIGFLAVVSCKSSAVAVSQLPKNQKHQWDSLYYFWISNGMGTCTPMMETELQNGKCTQHLLTVRMRFGSDGTVKKITVLKNNISCDDPAVGVSLEKCMLSTLKTDFVFSRDTKGIVLETTVGGPPDVIPSD